MKKAIYWYKLREKGKSYFFNFINNAVFRKTIEQVRKRRNIKLVTKERRSNHLVSEPHYHTTNFFTKKMWAWAIKLIKTQILIKKSVYLDLPILDLSKTKMYKFWYDYVKPNLVKMKFFVTWIQTVSLFI